MLVLKRPGSLVSRSLGKLGSSGSGSNLKKGVYKRTNSSEIAVQRLELRCLTSDV